MTDRPSDEPESTVRRSSIVDAALYRDGKRISTPSSLAETYRQLRADAEAMAWIGLYKPSDAELLSLADEFDLHQLAVEDAIEAISGPSWSVTARRCSWCCAPRATSTPTRRSTSGRCTCSSAPTSSHRPARRAPDLSGVRRRMEDDPDLLRLGPESVLYAVLDSVVDGYAPVVTGLQNDIDEIEVRGVRPRPRGVAAHLRAVPRGDRVPAGDPTAGSAC